MKRMEDDREKFVLIAAGYEEPMKRFLDANPGLRSRSDETIEFPNYEPADLLKGHGFADSEDYELSPDAKAKAQPSSSRPGPRAMRPSATRGSSGTCSKMRQGRRPTGSRDATLTSPPCDDSRGRHSRSGIAAMRTAPRAVSRMEGSTRPRDTARAMSQQNVELVRRLYAELASEGSPQEFEQRMSDDALGRFLDPEIEWGPGTESFACRRQLPRLGRCSALLE